MTSSIRSIVWSTLTHVVSGLSVAAASSWLLIEAYESGRLLLGLWFSIRLTSLVWGLWVPGMVLGWLVAALALEAAQSGRSSRRGWLTSYLGTIALAAIALSAVFGSSVWLFSLLLGFRQPLPEVIAAHVVVLTLVTVFVATAVAIVERYVRPRLVPVVEGTRFVSALPLVVLAVTIAILASNARTALAFEQMPDGNRVLTRRSEPYPGVGADSSCHLTNYTYEKDWIVRVDIDVDGDGTPECIRRGGQLTVLRDDVLIPTTRASCKEALRAPRD